MFYLLGGGRFTTVGPRDKRKSTRNLFNCTQILFYQSRLAHLTMASTFIGDEWEHGVIILKVLSPVYNTCATISEKIQCKCWSEIDWLSLKRSITMGVHTLLFTWLHLSTIFLTFVYLHSLERFDHEAHKSMYGTRFNKTIITCVNMTDHRIFIHKYLHWGYFFISVPWFTCHLILS